jgi:hypothetical protein
VLLRAKCEGVTVDTSVGVTGVSLVGLDNVEVGALTLGEAVLAVKLKLGNNDGVLSPAVHVQRRLGHDERTGIRDGGVVLCIGRGLDDEVSSQGSSRSGFIRLELVVLDEALTVKSNLRTGKSLESPVRSEGMKSVGKSINGISVVEGLSTEELEKGGVTDEGRAVVDVSVGLDNPDELLDGVVEVQLDLVGRRTDGLVTSELKLGDEILVGVLGEAATLVSIQEDVVNVEGSSNQGLVVGNGGSLGDGGIAGATAELSDGPQALVNGAKVKVDLDLVVLKSDQRKGKTRVGTVPELKGNVKSGLGKGVARGADLTRSVGVTGTINIGETRVGDEGKTSGVTNHLEVSRLLGRGHGELVPDVHPVTILAVDALSTDLNLNLGDQLLSREVQPTGIDLLGSGSSHGLVDLRKSDLKVGTVGKITVAADRASHTTAEISLSIEGLFNRLNGKVGVSAVSNLPEGNLRISSQIDVLSAVGYELHKSASHDYTISKEKKILTLR